MFFPQKTPRCKPRANKRLKQQEQLVRLKEQAQMLHNITSSSPNSPYASLAIASSPPAMPLPRSPVPPLKLLPREPPNGGGVGERQGKDAAMQEASFVKDTFASFLSDQVKLGREESSSEPISAPSRAHPAAASGYTPKVARYKRRERIENGCEGTEVLQDETQGLRTWRDVTNSLPDNHPPSVSPSTKSSRSTKSPATQHL